MANPTTTQLLSGSGHVSFNGATFYDNGEGVTINLIEEEFTRESSLVGEVGTNAFDRRIELNFTPLGEFEAVATLHPHIALGHGASPFGASDTACTFFGEDGRKIVLTNAAVTTCPNFIGGPDRTLWGPCTITGLLKHGGHPTDADAYYTETTAAYPGDAGFDPDAVLTRGYIFDWGAIGGFAEFYNDGGFELAVDIDWNPRGARGSGYGTLDYRLNNITASLTVSDPVGPTVAQLLAALNYQDSGNGFGSKAVSGFADLNAISDGADTYVRLYNAKLAANDQQIAFARDTNMIGDLTFRAQRSFTAAVRDPLYYIGASAPV